MGKLGRRIGKCAQVLAAGCTLAACGSTGAAPGLASSDAGADGTIDTGDGSNDGAHGDAPADAPADVRDSPESAAPDAGPEPSPFGVVHPADPCEAALAHTGFVNNWWDQGSTPASLTADVSALAACGKTETPLVWTAPDWNDTQANITTAMTAYFTQNPSIPVWQFGWEEDFNGRCCSAAQLDTLHAELVGVAAARSAAGVNTRIAYQLTADMAQVQAFLASPAAALVDVLALHPYDFGEFRTPEVWLSTGDATGVVERVMAWIAGSANPKMALFFTETGAPVCDTPGGCRLDESGTSVRGQDPDESAAFMVKTHVVSFHAGAQRILWYQRGSTPDPVCAANSPAESCFGMTNTNGPRPVLAAYKALTGCIAGRARVPTFTAPQAGVRAYRFGPAAVSGSCVVAWTFDGTTQPTLPTLPAISGVPVSALAGGATVKSVLDTTGSTICSGASCVAATVTLTPAPVLIETE